MLLLQFVYHFLHWIFPMYLLSFFHSLSHCFMLIGKIASPEVIIEYVVYRYTQELSRTFSLYTNETSTFLKLINCKKINMSSMFHNKLLKVHKSLPESYNREPFSIYNNIKRLINLITLENLKSSAPIELMTWYTNHFEYCIT